MLEASVFHPQGGGQPADTGVIRSGTARFLVADVKKDAAGTVRHYGRFEAPGSTPSAGGALASTPSAGDAPGSLPGAGDAPGSLLSAGDTVECRVDADRRMRNARTHTAGHLLDTAMLRVGNAVAGAVLVPSKGYHFPDSPYVEYIGKLDPAKKERCLFPLSLPSPYPLPTRT